MCLFSDFQFGFRSSRSTADLLTVVSERIARAFNKSGATIWVVALDITKAFDRVSHADLLRKLKSWNFRSDIWPYFFFSVIDGFKWFGMESLLKNIQLKLKFLKAPFLVLHFSCYILMTFLMLSVILLSILMMLLSILSMIRHLICSNNLNWFLNLNLIYETLWTGVRSGLLISMLKKLNWFCLTVLIAMYYWCENGWFCSWGKIIF